MAAGDGASSQSRHIISQIVGRIDELSQALEVEQSSLKTSSTLLPNESTEAEIRHVFGRSSNRGFSTSSSSTAQTVQTRFPPASTTTTSALPQRQPPLYTMRNNFSNQRTNSRYKRKTQKKSKVSGGSGPFSRDVILLAGPNDQEVPRQTSKVFLQENGHIISAFEFQKEWSEIDVEIEIRNAFEETLPDDVDFEIVYSVHTKLSKPTLAPSQLLTGAVLNRIFKDNKPVYVRPCKELLFHKVSYSIF